MPEVTGVPEITGVPEVTGVTGVPEITGVPEVTGTMGVVTGAEEPGTTIGVDEGGMMKELIGPELSGSSSHSSHS